MIIPKTVAAQNAAHVLLSECLAARPTNQELHRFIGALRKALGMPSNNDLRKR